MTTERSTAEEWEEGLDPDVTHFGLAVIWIATHVPIGGWPANLPRPAVPALNVLLSGGEDGYVATC